MNHRDLAAQICELTGLDPDDVARLSIEADAKGPLRIVAEVFSRAYDGRYIRSGDGVAQSRIGITMSGDYSNMEVLPKQ